MVDKPKIPGIDSPFARPLRVLSQDELSEVSGGEVYENNMSEADLPPKAKSVNSTDNQGRNHS